MRHSLFDSRSFVENLSVWFKGGLNLLLRICGGVFFCPSSAIFSPIALATDSKMSFDGQKDLRKQISQTNFKPPVRLAG
ncbi:MAG: hypothetical protein AAF998_21290 [Bacteroidota bacterium]